MAVFFTARGAGDQIRDDRRQAHRTSRQAALPIIAACGGVPGPHRHLSIFNATNPETSHGWGVPTATDIAFALGIMALLGNRVPNGVRVFLSHAGRGRRHHRHSRHCHLLRPESLAHVACHRCGHSRGARTDEPGARVRPDALCWWLSSVVRRVHVRRVHSTIAGVLLAFTIPTGSRVDLSEFMTWSGDRVREANAAPHETEPVTLQKDYYDHGHASVEGSRQVVPPATRLEHMLYPWVYFAVLPLFALTNADVSFLGGDVLAMVSSPVFFGVFFGLLLGKPIGILLFSFLTVKFKIANLPDNVNWVHMLGARHSWAASGSPWPSSWRTSPSPRPCSSPMRRSASLSASLLAGVIGSVPVHAGEGESDARASLRVRLAGRGGAPNGRGRGRRYGRRRGARRRATRIWSTMCARCWKPRAAWRSSSCTRSATRPRPRRPRTSPARALGRTGSFMGFRACRGRSFRGALFHASSRFREQQARYSAAMRSAMA